MSSITLVIGEPIPISAANRMGLGDMLDEVAKHFPEDADTKKMMKSRELPLWENQT